MTERTVLDRRRLNRATMCRQGLAQPWTWSPAEAIRHLVGLQSQLPDPPYLGLWTRLDTFALDDLTRLLHERTVVRSGFVRGTWKISRKDGVAALSVDLFTPLPDADRAALATEGRRLLAFAAADATEHALRI